MRKENILVVALVVISIAVFFGYKRLNPSGSPAPGPAIAQVQASVPAEPSTNPAGKIPWKNYTPGMALAKKEGKSIFLYFHADWCTYCTKLKKTTFRDDAVTDYLRANFVSIRVDTDRHQELAQEWRVKGLPTMWFLTPGGEKINQMPGYVSATQLIQILKYIHTKSYTTMEFHEFVKNG